MCFRPPEAGASQVCPECGKKVSIIADIRQETCPFCGAAYPDEDEAPAAAPAAPSAPTAPGAPVAPGAPR